MVTTERGYFRKKLGEELKQEGKKARKILKQANRKPSYHNQMCVLMGRLEDLR